MVVKVKWLKHEIILIKTYFNGVMLVIKDYLLNFSKNMYYFRVIKYKQINIIVILSNKQIFHIQNF